jgi:RNA polymerase sigma-70 factor, ECF subfamily
LSERHFAYILSLVGNPDTTRDIQQETNVVLWRKAGEFKEGSNFMPWALGIARMQVLTFRRDHQRDRHVFDDQVFKQLASEYAATPDDPDDRQRTFEDCFEQLPERQQELLAARYAPGGSVKDIAETRGQSAGALSVTLSRLRKAMANCIRRLDNSAGGEEWRAARLSCVIPTNRFQRGSENP